MLRPFVAVLLLTALACTPDDVLPPASDTASAVRRSVLRMGFVRMGWMAPGKAWSARVPLSWIIPVGALASALLGTVDAVAMEDCREPTGHEVAWLEPMPDGLRAYLEKPYKRYENGRTLQRVGRYVNGAGWSAEPVRVCDGAGQPSCGPPWRGLCFVAECQPTACTTIQLPPYTAADINRRKWPYGRPELREMEQWVGACAPVGDFEYFGVSFYNSEGMVGIGGLGRKRSGGPLELRRPAILLEHSVTAMVVEGDTIWLAVNQEHECVGVTPGAGLVRYQWSKDKAVALRWPNGPCGEVINDLLWQAPSLWVATEQGLSVLDTAAGAWRHFAPGGAHGELRAATCPPAADPEAQPVWPEPPAVLPPPPAPPAVPVAPPALEVEAPSAPAGGPERSGCSCATSVTASVAPGMWLLAWGIRRRSTRRAFSGRG